jgi:hypothetical protein
LSLLMVGDALSYVLGRQIPIQDTHSSLDILRADYTVTVSEKANRLSETKRRISREKSGAVFILQQLV